MNARVRLPLFACVFSLTCATLATSDPLREWAVIAGELVLLLCISWKISLFLVKSVFASFVTPLATENKCVIVSGNESEVNTAIISKLCESGFKVFACVREKNGSFAEDLKRTITSKGLIICKMDRTEKKSIDACLCEIRAKMGIDEKIWGLVTYCGFPLISKIDWGNFDSHFNRVIEGDVIGLLHMVRECLPLVREAKGRIVNVTSEIDRQRGRPFHCAAAISSSTSYSLMECVRREVAYFGVHVINIQTDFGLHTLGSKAEMQTALNEVWQATSECMRSDAQLQRASQELAVCTDRRTRDSAFFAIADSTERALRARFPEFKYHANVSGSRSLLSLCADFMPDELRSCLAMLVNLDAPGQ